MIVEMLGHETTIGPPLECWTLTKSAYMLISTHRLIGARPAFGMFQTSPSYTGIDKSHSDISCGRNDENHTGLLKIHSNARNRHDALQALALATPPTPRHGQPCPHCLPSPITLSLNLFFEIAHTHISRETEQHANKAHSTGIQKLTHNRRHTHLEMHLN